VKRGKYKPRVFPALARVILDWHAQYSAIPKPRDICKMYGISRQQLYDVIHHRTHKWMS
jgi:hypothetical protein